MIKEKPRENICRALQDRENLSCPALSCQDRTGSG